MENYREILTKVRAYAARAGTSPESVCRAATQNPRLWRRLQARIDTLDRDVARIEAHMQNNPTGGENER